MVISVDLHTHTFLSDGTLSPEDLVLRAKNQGVQVLAVTDHDTTDGLAAARAAANKHGIDFIPGVEISVSWQGRTIHIVGLNIDPENEALAIGLALLRQKRNERADSIGEKLVKKNIDNALDGAMKLAGGNVLSRTHFAQYLVNEGYSRNIQHAFRHYLGDNKPGFVKAEWTSLDQAVGWIRESGGKAVIAHPGRYKMGRCKMNALLEQFRACGGNAIEVISGSQHPEETPHFARLAAEFELQASVGSDFHSPEQRWLELGRLPALPENCNPVWKSW